MPIGCRGRNDETTKRRSTKQYLILIRSFAIRSFVFSQQQATSLAGRGSTGNVIADLYSFFIPGLGQLIQGRLIMAIVHFVLAAALWFFFMGWIIHLWSILNAARFKPES